MKKRSGVCREGVSCVVLLLRFRFKLLQVTCYFWREFRKLAVKWQLEVKDRHNDNCNTNIIKWKK